MATMATKGRGGEENYKREYHRLRSLTSDLCVRQQSVSPVFYFLGTTILQQLYFIYLFNVNINRDISLTNYKFM
jgi:hypothetical protein